jgi:hypothetical protein
MAVGEAFVEIGVDFAQLRRSLNKAKGEFATNVKRIEGNAARAGGRIGQSLGRGLKTGLKAATVGLGALFVSGGLAVKSFITSQKESLRLAKTLKATGNAAGFTAAQLEDAARKLQYATFVDDKEIKRAQNAILSFTNITKDQFKQATKAALDLAVMFDKNVQETAIRLGRALADPVRGLEGLRESGVLMTKQQEDMIKSMFQMGKVAEAQNEVFEVLRQNGVDGNADAMADLADQWEQSKNVLEDIVVSIGKAIAGMFGLTDGSTNLSDAFKAVRDSIKEVIDTGFFKDLGTVMLPILKHVAKLTVMIAGGLAMMAAAATALLKGEGFAAMDKQILAISDGMKKTILTINRFGKANKKAGEEGKKGSKNQVDANKKLKEAIEARIKTFKEELAAKHKLLSIEEKTLKNMHAVRDAVKDIASISTVGIEDMFSTRNVASVERAKKDLQGVIDADIEQQKGKIKAAKQGIKTLESKLRAEGVQRAAAQQVKNQEVQIELDKERNRMMKQQKGGSVFSNE